MPRHFCHSCRALLHAADKHGECVPCLGAAHAETALTGTECHHCGDMSLSSLHSRLAFFSESNPALRALPLFSYQGPARKKQWGRGSQHPEMSELTPAVTLHTPLSPHREFLPVLFTRPDQHPSVAWVGAIMGRWTTACHWRLQMRRSCQARTTTPPPCILHSTVHPAYAWTFPRPV